MIFIQINFLFACNYKKQKNIFLDKLFNYFTLSNLSTEYCIQLEISRYFYYRGKPKDFEDILISNKLNLNGEQSNFNILDEKTKYEKYPAIFINKTKYLDYIFLFSNKTLFFLENEISLNKTEKQKYKNYCILSIFAEDYYSYSYFIITNDLTDLYFRYVKEALFLLLLINCFLSLIFAFYIIFSSFGYYFKSINIYRFILNNFIFIFLFYSVLNGNSFIVILCHLLLYSIYKASFIGHLLLFLDGFSILYFGDNLRKRIKFYLEIFLVEILFNIFFEYIIYFIPSLDNFELFSIKNLFEATTILILYLILKFYKFFGN